ncbi:hypothetical protein [Lysobacter sp. Root494]|uniref:hypothetical protein n=1 Tax=Lysobacter sp. Root494 TaxID=1736549 RepID=UPI0006F87A96|nr:hypothetical protein [Lysobacter sp. Root494]KQY51090.1 hypothetical protein ASD14_09725 [Lysobacter sp. Root494]
MTAGSTAKPGIVAFACACLLAACSQPPGSPEAATPAKPASVARAAPDAPSPTTGTPAGRSTEYVLPGDFAPDATVETLRKRFGDTQVKVGDVPGAEGETFNGVILFPGDSTRRAYLYFQDEQALRGLSLVRVFEPDTHWRLDDGIAMGMTLAELVQRNGHPIDYTGLGWDYGGTVTDLHDGALTPPGNDAVMRSWKLGPKDIEHEAAADAYPVGEGTFSSADPRYPEQGRNVAVRELSISFPGEDDL